VAQRTSTTGRLAGDLLEVVMPMQRMLRRRVREDWPLEALPTAQVDLLRAVRLRPGVSVGEAAVELRVAPNTASTLVNQLAAAGYLERKPDAHDRRSIRLWLTPAAEARVKAWRDRRRQVLEAALDEMDEDERAAVDAALPALRRLGLGLER
jgi:DNA-binding MarR family transcriptional regulator